MGKWCNFDTNNDGQLVCLEHSPMGAPALCTHAAAKLEALWKEGADSMKACWHAACNDIARLELEAQTYAEVAAGLQQEKTRLEEEKVQLEVQLSAERDSVAYVQRECHALQTGLAHAEAREAAMLEALEHCKQELDAYHSQEEKRAGGAIQPSYGMVLAEAALSPNAGRAP